MKYRAVYLMSMQIYFLGGDTVLEPQIVFFPPSTVFEQLHDARSDNKLAVAEKVYDAVSYCDGKGRLDDAKKGRLAAAIGGIDS